MQKLQLQFQIYIAVTILIFLGLFYIRFLNRQIDDLKQRVAQVEELSRDQQAVDRAVVEATDTVVERDRHVSEQAAQAIVDVRAAPGADQAVPVDVSNSWRTAIIGMRNSAPIDGGSNSPPKDDEGNVSGAGTTRSGRD